ncbi:MAG: IS1595 family transposase [Desulfovibrio sp.]|jgi:transposase-like protein|nr:IS1595 family transposase [Desulfovibrio sp.]
MDNAAFQNLLAVVDDFTDAQKAAFKKALDGGCDFEKVVMILDAYMLAKGECPRCHSKNINRWGRQSGLQRFRCYECGRSFNALTGTPLARLRRKEEWLKMGSALKEGLTVKKTAEKCETAISTAFRWRHRFLKAIQSDMSNKLEGIAEADETYFLESCKGARQLARAPRKRGGKAHKPGISREQVPVLVARDRAGGIVDAVLPDQSKRSVKQVLGCRVSKENILCIDGGNALWGFVCEAKIPCKVMPSGKFVHERNPIFHIQNINSYHSRLKTWIRVFNGVATKYLPNYLGWRRMYERQLPAVTPTAWVQAAARPVVQ